MTTRPEDTELDRRRSDGKGEDGGGVAEERALLELLEEARARERFRTYRYRALAAEAGRVGDDPAEERLNELHADEQHHLSRLTARLLELGFEARPLPSPPAELPGLEGWEAREREEEREEVRFYENALAEGIPDPVLRDLFEEILIAERMQFERMGGKWMRAAPDPILDGDRNLSSSTGDSPDGSDSSADGSESRG